MGGHRKPVLYCFAHAGGGGSVYTGWRQRLAGRLEVRPVVLPGRESRRSEPALTEMAPLVAKLAAEITADSGNGRFVLFGHSLGAILAFEIAAALELAGGPVPAGLVVSGRRAPALPARQEPKHNLDEDQLVEHMSELGGTPPEVLENRTLLRLFLPTFRADLKLNETYRYRAGVRVGCPLSAYTGDADPLVTPDEVAAWRSVTSASFGLRVFAGGHFYLHDNPPPVLAALLTDVEALIGADPVPAVAGSYRRGG